LPSNKPSPSLSIFTKILLHSLSLRPSIYLHAPPTPSPNNPLFLFLSQVLLSSFSWILFSFILNIPIPNQVFPPALPLHFQYRGYSCCFCTSSNSSLLENLFTRQDKNLILIRYDLLVLC
jgi:hypothetical protein